LLQCKQSEVQISEVLKFPKIYVFNITFIQTSIFSSADKVSHFSIIFEGSFQTSLNISLKILLKSSHDNECQAKSVKDLSNISFSIGSKSLFIEQCGQSFHTNL
jgi:hypothetical protein